MTQDPSVNDGYRLLGVKVFTAKWERPTAEEPDLRSADDVIDVLRRARDEGLIDPPPLSDDELDARLAYVLSSPPEPLADGVENLLPEEAEEADECAAPALVLHTSFHDSVEILNLIRPWQIERALHSSSKRLGKKSHHSHHQAFRLLQRDVEWLLGDIGAQNDRTFEIGHGFLCHASATLLRNDPVHISRVVSPELLPWSLFITELDRKRALETHRYLVEAVGGLPGEGFQSSKVVRKECLRQALSVLGEGGQGGIHSNFPDFLVRKCPSTDWRRQIYEILQFHQAKIVFARNEKRSRDDFLPLREMWNGDDWVSFCSGEHGGEIPVCSKS